MWACASHVYLLPSVEKWWVEGEFIWTLSLCVYRFQQLVTSIYLHAIQWGVVQTLSQVVFNWMNQIFHLFVSPIVPDQFYFWVQLYWTFWTDLFSGNAMFNSENKLITTTTTTYGHESRKVFPRFWLSWCRDLALFYSDGGAIDSVSSNQTTTSESFT